jgi:hypothetical protein
MPIPARLRLKSVITGQLIAISITTTFGKSLLMTFAGNDALYASEPQFVILKDASRGGWFLEHAATAKNPTYLDGSPALDASRKLDTTQVISIGPEKMKLEVSFG